MPDNYLVLDLETRESFQDVRSFNPADLTISLVGIHDTTTNTDRAYRLEELSAVAGTLREAPRVIGFNILGFDYAVLKAAFAKHRLSELLDPYALPTIDLFDHLQRELGFRPKLDHLAFATLGRGKSGHGLEAIRLFQTGKWEALARYCLDDVRITKELYEYGLQHGHVKFPDRDGSIREVKATWVPVPEQVRLF